MRLKSIKIRDFRSIEEEQFVLEDTLTALVGPNEGGKTNTLNAIQKVSQSAAVEESDKRIDALPHDDEGSIPTIIYTWEIDREEAEEIFDKCVPTDDPVVVKVSREGTGPLEIESLSNVRPLPRFENPDARKVKIPKKDGSTQETQSQGFTLTDEYDLEKFKEKMDTDENVEIIEEPEDSNISFRDINNHLPDIFFWDESQREVLQRSYPVDQFRSNPDKFQPLKNIFKLAGRDQQQIRDILDQDRTTLVNKLDEVSEEATAALRRRWNQNQDISLDLDYGTDQIFVYIKEDGTRIEPDRRSEGFRWFLTFFINFVSEIDGEIENKLILLDEPGLILHPRGQKDLISILEDIAESNQVVYSTPSPFMIPKGKISHVRIVERENLTTDIRDTGKEDLQKDEVVRNLLGLDFLDSYLVSEQTIVVEGPIDERVIHFVNEKLLEEHRQLDEDITPLRMSEIAIINSGGASQSVNIAKFLQKNGIKYTAVFDHDQQGRDNMENLKQWIDSQDADIKKNRRVFGINGVKEEAETIEDLFPKKVVLEAVNEHLSEQGIRPIEDLQEQGGWVREIRGKLMANGRDPDSDFEKFAIVRNCINKLQDQDINDGDGEVNSDFEDLIGLITEIKTKLELQEE